MGLWPLQSSAMKSEDLRPGREGQDGEAGHEEPVGGPWDTPSVHCPALSPSHLHLWELWERSPWAQVRMVPVISGGLMARCCSPPFPIWPIAPTISVPLLGPFYPTQSLVTGIGVHLRLHFLCLALCWDAAETGTARDPPLSTVLRDRQNAR